MEVDVSIKDKFTANYSDYKTVLPTFHEVNGIKEITNLDKVVRVELIQSVKYVQYMTMKKFISICELNDRPNWAARRKGNRTWYGTDTYEEAIDLAKNGWEKGQKIIKKISSPIVDKLMTVIPRIKITHDRAGDDVNIPAFIANIPDHWDKYNLETHQGPGKKQLRFAISNDGSGGVGSIHFLMKGIAITALIAALEASEIPVELYVTIGTAKSYGGTMPNHYTLTLIKEAGKVLDLKRISYACAHPSYLRRLWFGYCEMLPKKVRDAYGYSGGGYGCPHDLSDKEQRELKLDLYVPYTTEFTSFDVFNGFLIENLKKFGIKLSTDSILSKQEFDTLRKEGENYL